ncbi:MAG: DUF6580 family putative transport protein [Saprospiraceae bacterium]
MKLKSSNSLLISTVFIIGAAFSRLITVLPNFSVIESLALFGGAYIVSKYKAILIPVLALFLSDLVLNNTILRVFYPNVDGAVIFPSYLIWSIISMVFIVGFGSVLLKKVNALRVLGGVLGSTAIFFIISNFGVWMTSLMYPKNLGGLIGCYVAAIPFVMNSLIGNLVFGAILFGSYELITRLRSSELAKELA